MNTFTQGIFYIGFTLFFFTACNKNKNSSANSTDKTKEFTDCAMQEAANQQFEKALNCMDEAIALQPKNYDFYATKFNLLLLNKQYDTCLVFLKKLHQLKENNSEAYSFEGYLNEKAGNTATAQEYYLKAIQACKIRVQQKQEMFKNKVNIAFLKFFTEGRVASLNYMDSLVMRHPGNGFVLDKKEFMKNFNKLSKNLSL